LADLAVVSYSLSTNGGAEGLEGAGTEKGSLGTTRSSAAELAAWLVEPGAYTTLPILSEVVFVEDYLHRKTQKLSDFDLVSTAQDTPLLCAKPIDQSEIN